MGSDVDVIEGYDSSDRDMTDPMTGVDEGNTDNDDDDDETSVRNLVGVGSYIDDGEYLY